MDRVVTEENTKLYRVTVRLGSMEEGVGEPITFKDAQLVVDNPVPVYGLDGQHIGHAVVYLGTFRGILADLAIDYETPERLLIEAKAERIYPWILGTVELRKGEILGSLELLNLQLTEPLAAAKLQVGGVALRRRAPSGYVPEVGATVAA